jgi:FdrA protein
MSMSVQKTFVQRNRYADSVTLMGIADRVKRSCGVDLVEVQMGTPANLEVLRGLGFKFSDGTGSGDLIVAIEAKDEAALETAYGQVVDRLDHKGTAQEDGASFNTLEEAGSEAADCDLCLISLPGEYAAAEAEKAINMGLDVFIFSDNVSLEEELHLKRLGEEKDVLVMGPDCGVGLLGGVALATGSIVGSGPVGIVAASGSGAQEVPALSKRPVRGFQR